MHAQDAAGTAMTNKTAIPGPLSMVIPWLKEGYLNIQSGEDPLAQDAEGILMTNTTAMQGNLSMVIH